MAKILTSYTTYSTETLKDGLKYAREEYKKKCQIDGSTFDPECDDVDRILSDQNLDRFLPNNSRVGTMPSYAGNVYFPLSVISQKDGHQIILQPNGQFYTRTIDDESPTLPQLVQRSEPQSLALSNTQNNDAALFANIVSASTYNEFAQTAFISQNELFQYEPIVRAASYYINVHDKSREMEFFLNEN